MPCAQIHAVPITRENVIFLDIKIDTMTANNENAGLSIHLSNGYSFVAAAVLVVARVEVGRNMFCVVIF